ncbi:FxsA family protein [Micavibrio aeruginosavorus]|uniref:FxsA cytoplasmic membrane family protein n=1 Tax=Micavibrio aeruginosavorus (strain ARL-13) TaxID=856793 RepID=G2KNX2_MICAA|nr:FxsA family protein [Micavibrio aeruginosavorus]AEP10767.1 fxsA cytoplasmic membrane family protein [Micavibrio aeruginosavorus ARL-13]
MVFLILFILIPLIEIALFAAIGGEIGVLNTLLLCVASATAGVMILQRQGLKTFFNLNEANNRGEIPIQQIFDGFCLFIAGILLIIPGFFTDFIAFALLIPPIRVVLRQSLAGWVQVHGFPGGPGARPGQDGPNGPSSTYTALDVEYEEISVTDPDDDTKKIGS